MKSPGMQTLFAPRKSKAITFNSADNGQIVCASTSVVWSLLSSDLQPRSTDRSFWWRTTGAILAETLDQAKYSWIDQCSTLYFYYAFITPRLGPRPRPLANGPKWRSFMTDDYSPIEYSWTWSTSSKTPEIRYSVELIGPEAGTPLDPFNQVGTIDLVTQLQASLPQTDWTWFHAFYDAFQTRSLLGDGQKDFPLTNTELATQSSPSSMFLAFEHRRSKPPVPKAYFVPAQGAHDASYSATTVVNKALASLPNYSSDLRSSFPAYTYLADFLAQDSLGKQLTLTIVAIDCLPLPQESRFKQYFRSPSTDFASVSHILRLGNPISMSGSGLSNLPSPRQLQRLESLFRAILPLTNSSSSAHTPLSSTSSSFSPLSPLHNNTTTFESPKYDVPNEHENPKHETAGMLFYFDCAPSQSIPKPKIYLPVKHYAASDESAWQALKEWLREENGESYMTEWGTRFENLMGKMGVGRGDGVGGLDRGMGRESGESAKRVQTYVSVGFDKNDKLNVTSYFGPVLYGRRG